MEPTEIDLRLFKECFDRNRSPRTLEHLRWQYLGPPPGRLLVDLALTPGASPSVVAVYAVFPSWMRAQGRTVLGVQSLDTLTDEAYRGKGLFVRMARVLYDRCSAEKVALVYGIPNGNSAHGFFNRLGWSNLDPVPALVRPLRSGYALRKIRLPRGLTEMLDFRIPSRSSSARQWVVDERPVSTIDAEFDALWERFSAEVGYAVKRDGPYLRWRLQRPDRPYKLLTVSENGRLVGWSAHAITQADGYSVGTIMDLIVEPARQGAGVALLAETLGRMTADGCAVAWAWNFEHAPNHAIFRNAGFFSPPVKLHFGVRNLTLSAPTTSDRSRWYVSYLDSDTH